jgi:chemotaxis protein CheX
MNNPKPHFEEQAAELKLPAILDQKAAAELLKDILDRRGQDLILETSQVSRLGGQCLQILIAAVNGWQSDGRQLSFVNPSVAFIHGLDLFGVLFDGLSQREPLICA